MEDYRIKTDDELEAIVIGGRAGSGALAQADAKMALDLRVSRRQLEAALSLATFTRRLFIATGVLAFATIVLAFVSAFQTYSAIRQAHMSRTSTSEASSGRRTVSWYLMVPHLGESEGSQGGKTVPLNQWKRPYTFDSEASCEDALAAAYVSWATSVTTLGTQLGLSEKARMEIPDYIHDWFCVASDDPRLKEKVE